MFKRDSTRMGGKYTSQALIIPAPARFNLVKIKQVFSVDVGKEKSHFTKFGVFTRSAKSARRQQKQN